MLRPLLPIPPIHFFTHSSSLFLVPPGSSFSFFPPSFYYQLCLSAPLYCRPLSMPLSVSSTLCLLCCFVLSDCIADFGPFLPSYWLLRPVHPHLLQFPHSPLHPLLPLFVLCYRTYTNAFAPLYGLFCSLGSCDRTLQYSFFPLLLFPSPFQSPLNLKRKKVPLSLW